MHILYAVTTCSDRTYARLFGKVANKPGFQSQKYHRLLIEGLSAGAEVEVIANVPSNPSVLSQSWQRLGAEEEGGAVYWNLPVVRNSALKAAVVGVGTFWGTVRRIRKDSVVIVDVLNRTAALAGMLAARLRGKRCVGIVTDLPDMLGGSRLSKWLSRLVIRGCTNYVLLTEAMNTYIGNQTKPYVVLEGHADVAMAQCQPGLDKKAPQRICLYAGGLYRKYGIPQLVEGFLRTKMPNTRLDLYGSGDYLEELKAIAKQNPRVYYGGMLLSSQVVEKEMEATLLVNPRPTNEEYVRYSFPSKTMEYMSTGTPVLTTVLPGMPQEYYPYVYLIEDESPEGIGRALEKVLSQKGEVLFEKGMAAREFILSEKNNVIQGAKILEMLRK